MPREFHYYVYQPTNAEGVTVYNQASLCENLRKITPEEIIPFLLYVYCAARRFSMEEMQSKFNSIQLDFIKQPDASRQNDAYDGMSLAIYEYIITLIPKNETMGFNRYVRNKKIGLKREAERVGMIYDDSDLDLATVTLREARVFFNRHRIVYKECFLLLLAVANPSVQGAGYGFAVEMLTSVEYANMQGIKMIKDHLLDDNHPVLMNSSLTAHLKNYRDFVEKVKAKHGKYWIYCAVIDYPLYSEYARTVSFRFLWKVAAIAGMSAHDTYASLKIDNEDVSTHAMKDEFKDLFDPVKKRKPLLTTNGMYSQQEVADYSSSLKGWFQQMNSRNNGNGNRDEVDDNV